MIALHHPINELTDCSINFRCMLTRLPVSIYLLLHVVHLAFLHQDSELRSLSDEFWEWKLREFPESATQARHHEYDDVLETYTMETFHYRYRNCSLLLERARQLDRDQLSASDDVTLSVLIDQLEMYTNGYKWRNYGNLNPISFMEGIHLYNSWVKFGNYVTLDDFNKYIRRLNALPIQIDQIITLMRKAIELGSTYHQVSVADVPRQLDTIINAPVEDSHYYEPFLIHLNESALTAVQRASVVGQGKQAILNAIQPAYNRLKTFLQQEYFPNTRTTYGVSSFPNGAEYYRDVLKWHLSVDVDPSTVHQIGKEEVHRIRTNMIQLMNNLNFCGDLTDFVHDVENTQSFFNHSGPDLLDEYRHIVYERIEPKLPEIFRNTSAVPRPLIKALGRDGIIAMYMDSALYVNINRPHTRPSYTIMAVALHEANPGHHYQVTLAQDLPFPNFRRYIWARKYSAPFHFPYYTAYVEGWGLYAEYLGEELELYKDPYELFGRYTIEMFRACRLVVDTGIHYYNWSRADAISYMRNYTYMSEQEVAIEIDRYITWPGQACAYKFGEIKIREIRAHAENILGELFDIRDFHWQVIKVGFVPLRILESSINHWIDTILTSAAPNHQASTTLTLCLLAYVTTRVLNQD